MLIWLGVLLGPPASQLYDWIMKEPPRSPIPLIDAGVKLVAYGLFSLIFSFVAAYVLKRIQFFR